MMYHCYTHTNNAQNTRALHTPHIHTKKYIGGLSWVSAVASPDKSFGTVCMCVRERYRARVRECVGELHAHYIIYTYTQTHTR